MMKVPITQARGMQLVDANGQTYLDLTAALASALGHRYESIDQALAATLGSYCGSWIDEPLPDWHQSLGAPFTDYSHAWVVASADQANELALRMVRSYAPKRHRVLTLLGGDHGDTYLLRSASGRPEAQAADGPVVAGFRHLAAGDLKAMEACVDEQTIGILISPIDWNRHAEVFDTAFLCGVEQLCRERGLLWILDETRIPFGIAGTPWLHQRAEVTPDLVTLSAGLTSGLPGGLVLAGAKGNASRVDPQALAVTQAAASVPRLPLLETAIRATLQAVQTNQCLHAHGELADAWYAMLEEATQGFDFVNDWQTTGLWTTLSLDLSATDFTHRALASGLVVQPVDETTILLCPPINASEDVLLEAMQSLRDALEALERETTTA